MNTILYRDKALIRTLSSPIYKNENRADFLKFLIDADELTEFNTKNLLCMFCAILPDGTEGKVAFLNFEDKLYQEKYLVAYLPITKVITKFSGTLSLNLIFSYEDSNKLFHNLPTNNVSLTILESSSSDSFIDPDETTNPFSEIMQKLSVLEKSKISNIDINDHTVNFYADSGKTILIGTITLPEDVVWTTMEGM